MDGIERLGPDADASEIVKLMEDDFEQSVDEGIINTLPAKRSEDASNDGESS